MRCHMPGTNEQEAFPVKWIVREDGAGKLCWAWA